VHCRLRAGGLIGLDVAAASICGTSTVVAVTPVPEFDSFPSSA